MAYAKYDYKTMLIAEHNCHEYLNIPRTSLEIKDVLSRAIKGAPTDATDFSDSFAPEDDENDWTTDVTADDHVDLYEQTKENEHRLSAAAQAAAEGLKSDNEEILRRQAEQSEAKLRKSSRKSDDNPKSSKEIEDFHDAE